MPPQMENALMSTKVLPSRVLTEHACKQDIAEGCNGEEQLVKYFGTVSQCS
jgi:hypothetical protein